MSWSHKVWGKSLGNESSLYFLRAVDVKNKTKKNIETVKQ